MLIKVFGIWLMASNVAFLSPGGQSLNSAEEGCFVSFAGERYKYFQPYACNQVAAEINKQIKASKEQ
jgi:hypothetical protein